LDLQLVAFAVFAAVGVCAALLMVTRKNLVHAALYLIVTLFSVAAVFVLLQAEFLAAVQVLVYAGGIMVLFLFVILLVDVPRELVPVRRSHRVHVATAIALTAATVGLLAYYAVNAAPRAVAPGDALTSDGGNLETVALALFRHYLLPFEAVSVLLLVAMVGAILLARAKA
jgi:NADH-quinone oxidoreductase subunit J